MSDKVLSTTAGALWLRPSQWLTFIGSNLVHSGQTFVPWIKAWTWWGMQRILLIYTAKHLTDVLFMAFRKPKLGFTCFREISLMHWVGPATYFDKDTKTRIFLRQCGYHDVYHVEARNIEPWFYGDRDADDETNSFLDQMEGTALKQIQLSRATQAEEIQVVTRILTTEFRNFKEFSPEEVMDFFIASELLTMEKDQVIFSAEDTEEYFYGVVSGEIHLFCDGIGKGGVELIKVAGPNGCIVSLLSFLHSFAIGPQKYGDLKLYATCGLAGKYYRVPVSKLFDYMRADPKEMFQIICSILIRHQGFYIGLNDLTGILPRLHKLSYLDANYTPINVEPGPLFGTKLAQDAFDSLSEKYIALEPSDRKLCWVGILDSRTVVLRRYQKAHYCFYIYKGLLACTISKLRRSYNAIQFYLAEGQSVGWREAVAGMEMALQYQVADGAKALVIAIPDFLIRRYLEENPEKAAKLITGLLDRDSLLMRQISYSLRFSHSRANEAVYARGDFVEVEPHGVDGKETFAYLCLSGRLRFLLETGGKKSVSLGPRTDRRYGIIEKGDWFNLLSMYIDNPQIRRTVITDRFAQYVTVPRYLIRVITTTFREAAGYQCDYVARIIGREQEHTFLDTDKMAEPMLQVDGFGVHTSRTYRVVCVYPTTDYLPAKIYCDELARHHTEPALVITKEDALEDMKLAEFTKANDYSLAKWLVSKEEETTVLFVLANNNVSDHWNETIAKLCDMIHVLISSTVPHQPSANETAILQCAKKARKELVFIHPVIRVTKPQFGPSKYPHLPTGSILWLKPRKSWIQRHHHVRMLDSALKYAKEKNPDDLERYYSDTVHPDKHSDFARVMRWISGQTVGIVLGGGGAKGAAHVGTMHYLRELDVPADYIAGVSIGSFLGALYAVYENVEVVEAKAKELWENLKNPYRFARDLTVNPFSAIFRGHSFNWMINYFFGDIQIEDLYIPYFCVSTDLNDSCSRTHMAGDLWFYVRASMTLTLLFPPQINQYDYHLLMDGGYSDLVPAMTMRKLGIKYLVAINIGDESLKKTFNIGYHVSGFKCLLQSLMPHLIDQIPNYFDFWDAVFECSARNFILILKAMNEYVIYIRPNINAFTAADFEHYDEIKRLGYLSTKFKFGGLHLKNLPVHVIWYLLRFYTYPAIAQSQSQMLQGFTDEDWEFAVTLMSKTQMFKRAKNPFLKLNLTPYLVDLMEARSYLESYINDQGEIASINLNVPVLENFFRDDEKLDLVYAIARMKEWKYMEDFETIISKRGYDKDDFKVRTRVHAVSSQAYDLANARQTLSENMNMNKISHRFVVSKRFRPSLETDGEEMPFGTVKQKYSIRDLYVADTALFHAAASFRHIVDAQHYSEGRARKSSLYNDPAPSKIGSRVGFVEQQHRRTSRRTKRSFMSLGNIVNKFSWRSRGNDSRSFGSQQVLSRPAHRGQRLEEYRKYLTRADRKKAQEDDKMKPIVTLKQIRHSFQKAEALHSQEEMLLV